MHVLFAVHVLFVLDIMKGNQESHHLSPLLLLLLLLTCVVHTTSSRQPSRPCNVFSISACNSEGQRKAPCKQPTMPLRSLSLSVAAPPMLRMHLYKTEALSWALTLRHPITACQGAGS